MKIKQSSPDNSRKAIFPVRLYTISLLFKKKSSSKKKVSYCQTTNILGDVIGYYKKIITLFFIIFYLNGVIKLLILKLCETNFINI